MKRMATSEWDCANNCNKGYYKTADIGLPIL